MWNQKIDSYSKNSGEKNLLRYIEPKRAQGQAILMLNYADDIWMYFPRTKRIRKLATNSKSQKMEGSDFSYEDTGASDAFIEDFSSKKLGTEKKEGYDCYKIEMLKKEGIESGYSRLIMRVIKIEPNAILAHSVSCRKYVDGYKLPTAVYQRFG